MAIDPHTYLIEADLSRQDVVVLNELCSGNAVVEYGAGGSTVFLAKIASHLVSYEPDPKWHALATRRLEAESGYLCPYSVLLLDGGKFPRLPKADVYFIDGPRTERLKWAKHVVQEKLARVLVVHDSRRDEHMAGFGFLCEPPTIRHLKRIDLHPRDSNLLVAHLRKDPVTWRNWNLEETENRAPHLHLRET